MRGGRSGGRRGGVGDEGWAAGGEVLAQFAFWIGPEAHDEIEAIEPGLKRGRQWRWIVKLRPTGFGLRVHGVEQTGCASEFGGARIPDELDACVRPVFAQEAQRGQGDDEIAERSAAQDEDAFQGRRHSRKR